MRLVAGFAMVALLAIWGGVVGCVTWSKSFGIN
jgi:hypothetical protein